MPKHLLADTGAPICLLEVKHHFDQLKLDDKRYAHHFSRASHWGTRVVLRQVSAESEDIYDLILAIHAKVGGDYTKLEVDSNEVKLYLEYASQFLSNLGNYKSFGDSKFVPRINPESFKAIAQVSETSQKLYSSVADILYCTEPESANLLGYADHGHTTTYYGGGITVDEIQIVQNAMATAGLLPENTRLFKTGPKTFELRIASAVKPTETPAVIELPENSSTLTLVYGDHSREFAEIVKELTQAKAFARNESQSAMIKSYIESFRTGSMQAHKDSQAAWVADIGPAVETNLGFIESYRDPHGVRGEWEGLVAMVNSERTLKFASLVAAAKDYIKQLPWPAAFEKDEFTPPDFSSLEVMTFAGSGIPAGINIPNYDDIRINVGFKNVSLGNILSAKAPNEKITFVREEDMELFNKLRSPSFEVQVGIHELLGHGTGKLLSETAPGVYNFDITNPPSSPVTNAPISTYYKPGETWGSVFGSIAASYEECRAETVAMYLCTDPELLAIFGHSPRDVNPEAVDNGENILYISYLQMARAGLVALEFYDPTLGKWGQAHMQARFSILKCFMNAGEGFVTLDYTKEDMSDLVINLDRSKILSVGKPAVAAYLQKLHIYKTTADLENGSKLYGEMTAVDESMVKYRQLVMDAKLPRKQFVQSNSFVDSATGEVELKEYAASEIGMIESFAERAV
ncbi:dipeptidyl-peptidase III [Nadsonia fulvescens var. elongata DSM 6958]|uniref:Dipeptidyl peptidase 3 n=1 Tax=Nadsonia fulvescens var. elongata DSM 6958 TaxID=857566 RepID=A0A1E3PCV3_9ASCO|nr:dipeptidyl-peptidase III [Nadsonia fulvescens var. elongata DSM 6958]